MIGWSCLNLRVGKVDLLFLDGGAVPPTAVDNNDGNGLQGKILVLVEIFSIFTRSWNAKEDRFISCVMK